MANLRFYYSTASKLRLTIPTKIAILRQPFMTGQIKIPETGYEGHFEIIVSLNKRDEDGHFGPGMKV